MFAGKTYFPSYGTHHILLANQLLMHFFPHLHQPKVVRGDLLYLQSCQVRTQQVKPASTRLRGVCRPAGGAHWAGTWRQVACGSTGRWWASGRGRAGAWGEAQEGRGWPCVSMWAGVGSLRDGQQMGGPPGWGLAGRQGPGWKNRTRGRYLGQRPRHGGVR